MEKYSHLAIGRLLCGCLLLLMTKPSTALDAPINITGTVYIPTCTLNQGKDIAIVFDTIAPSQVNGQSGAQSLTIPVSCSYYKGTPYVKVVGTQLSNAPTNVLQATGAGNSNLGIALYMGDTVNSSYALALNVSGLGSPITKGLSSLNSSDGNFTLTAVPYTTDSAQLLAGTFSAAANITMIYQ